MPETFLLHRADRIADILYGVAIAKGVISYSAIARPVGTRADFLSQVLDQVSNRAVQNGEPMWSALVVSKETQRPRSGFYEMARRLRAEYSNLDDEVLWEREKQRCYDAAPLFESGQVTS
jgi:hypothetical protein